MTSLPDIACCSGHDFDDMAFERLTGLVSHLVRVYCLDSTKYKNGKAITAYLLQVVISI